MTQREFSDKQIKNFFKRVANGYPVTDLCRDLCIDEATFHKWHEWITKINQSNLAKAEQLENAKDYSNAFALYEELAELGVAQAQYRLGHMHDDGVLNHGTPDHDRAFFYFKAAARQGHLDSQYNLAGFYCTGEGVELSYADAYFWYRKAARQGDSDARSRMQAITDTISSAADEACIFLVREKECSDREQAFEAMIQAFRNMADESRRVSLRDNTERLRDLIIYLNQTWGTRNKLTANTRSELSEAHLATTIANISPKNYYEALADIIEFEDYEKACAKECYELIEFFTLESIKKHLGSDPIIGENISIVKELGVAFDGFSEADEDDEESYVTYVRRDALSPNFSYEDHEHSPMMVMPREELHVYSWYDRVNDTIEAINVEDHLESDRMSPVHVYRILSTLFEKYKNRVAKKKVANKKVAKKKVAKKKAAKKKAAKKKAAKKK